MNRHRPLAQTPRLQAPLLAVASLALAVALSACGGGSKPEPTATIPLPTLAPTLVASPVASPTQETAAAQEYTVEAGDTLTAIADKFGVTTDAIIAANDIANPDLIQPGDTLTIPAP